MEGRRAHPRTGGTVSAAGQSAGAAGVALAAASGLPFVGEPATAG